MQQASQKQSRKSAGSPKVPPASAPTAVADAAGMDQSMRRDLTLRLVQAQVADAVGLMMRSERHRHYSIGDLEWMLLPPLMLNQLLISYARPGINPAADAGTGEQAPSEKAEKQAPQAPLMAVAMVSWARISPEVFAKLDAQKKAGVPYRLAPQEWASGNIVRVIDTIGSPAEIKALLGRLSEKLSDKKPRQETTRS